MDAQERIGAWCAWGIILLSWMAFFLMLALMFRATGCNRSSEMGTQSTDIVAESVGFEARAKNGPLQRVQQGSLSSQPVAWFGSKRCDRSVATGGTLTRTKRDVFIDEVNGGKLQVCKEQSGKGASYICAQWFSTATVSQTLCI
jgi:hypothetical protein